MKKNKILLFIPMYNCEKQITRVLDQIDSEMTDYISEILVVDNHSKDNSLEVVKNYIANKNSVNITLVRNKENYSLGGSHKTAIKYAKQNGFDYLIVLHGDDQGNIKDFLPMLKSGEYSNYDCLLGSRFMRGSKPQNYSGFRKFGNRVFNFVYSVAALRGIKDLGAGLNMYNVKIFNSDYYIKAKDNLTFNCYMLLMSCAKKHRVKFVPISWREDDQVSNVKMFKQSFTTLNIALQYFFLKRSFMRKDHRDNKNFTYQCDVIARNFKFEEPKFHLIMPMGGSGSRFSKMGITTPKPLVDLQGKPFFYWATQSISQYKNLKSISFVVLQKHINENGIDKKIHQYFPKAKISILPEVLKGAVLTAMKGVEAIDDDSAIIINDCDHAFVSSELNNFCDHIDASVDGALVTFNSNEDKYSYIKYNKNKTIIGTVEKMVVSNDAICGAYYFKNKDIFLKYAEKYLVNCKYNEFFISGVYNEMCADNLNIQKFNLDLHLSFGVPEEYEEVKNSPLFKEKICK